MFPRLLRPNYFLDHLYVYKFTCMWSRGDRIDGSGKTLRVGDRVWGKVSDRIRGGGRKRGKPRGEFWVKLGPGRGHQENTCFGDPEVGDQGKNHSKSLGTNFTGGGDC